MLDSINQEMIVYKAPLVESIVSGELMDRVNACLDLPTTTEFALSALQELSGAQLLTDVSLFADKTQPILRLQMPVSALVDLVWWEVFARFAQATTSSATGTAWLALSTLTTTPELATAIATMDSSLINSVSALKNVVPMKLMTQHLKDVPVWEDWEESTESALFVLKELKQLLTVFARTVDKTSSYLTVGAFAEVDSLTTPPKSALPATNFQTASSSTAFAQYAPEVWSSLLETLADALKAKFCKDLHV
jgi:hypothetical protein